MVVEVQNNGTRSEVFNAQGLYFVPDGDPDKAPQRLGAAGPFQMEGQGSRARSTSSRWAPRPRPRCASRSSASTRTAPAPRRRTRSTWARSGSPSSSAHEIDSKAKAALGRHGGRMPAAKSAIQSEVWQARDKNWIKLDGERKQEKGSNGIRAAIAAADSPPPVAHPGAARPRAAAGAPVRPAAAALTVLPPSPRSHFAIHAQRGVTVAGRERHPATVLPR